MEKVWAGFLKRLEYQWSGFYPNLGRSHWYGVIRSVLSGPPFLIFFRSSVCAVAFHLLAMLMPKPKLQADCAGTRRLRDVAGGWPTTFAESFPATDESDLEFFPFFPVLTGQNRRVRGSDAVHRYTRWSNRP